MSFIKKSYCSFFLILLVTLFTDTHRLIAQDSIIQRIQYVFPCIVEITARNAIMLKVPGGTFIDKKTGQLIQLNGAKAAEYTRQGSGVIIDPAGIIVTNAHTVSDAARVEVRFMDDALITAQILKVIPEQDLAFLKVTPPYPVSRVEIIDSINIHINDEIITVGSSPFLKQTLSGGRVIGFANHRNPDDKNRPDLLQFNINIYPGDSGGPLFNSKGQLIGLMVAKQANQDRLCFAIPSDKIIKAYLKFLEEIKTKSHHE